MCRGIQDLPPVPGSAKALARDLTDSLTSAGAGLGNSLSSPSNSRSQNSCGECN